MDNMWTRAELCLAIAVHAFYDRYILLIFSGLTVTHSVKFYKFGQRTIEPNRIIQLVWGY